jgi:hypothetical protein
MAKTRKYNQRKSTRGKTPKKKNKMRQNKTKGGGERLSSCKNAKQNAECTRQITVDNVTDSYNGRCRNGKCVIKLKSLKIATQKRLNSMSSNTVKTRMKTPTPRFKYVTSTGNSYNRRKTLSEIFGFSK